MDRSHFSKSGIGALAYGILSYGLFLGVFLYAIAFVGGLPVPKTIDSGAPGPLPLALIVNTALLGLFAVQHSLMARTAFKRWWTRFVPEAIERSTYVLFSSLALVALFLWWEPIGGIVWNAPAGFARDAVISAYLFGWALLLYTTFLIDHFDLFGLKQVWRRLRSAPYVPPQFYTPSLYRFVRHPLYIGWLTIFWAAPTMTIAHLVFALATTAYILIAIQLEERDLVDAFGERYVAYRRSTPMLIPRPWRRAQAYREESNI